MLWFHCDEATGEIITGGMVPNIDAANLQTPPAGQVLLTAPDGSVSGLFTGTPDFTGFRNYLLAQVDDAAEATRQLFITGGSGQAMTYLRKETEARAYVANNTVATPFLTAEAAATGVTVAALAATVVAQANAWEVIGPKIEAARLGAKKAVKAATNIAEMHAASQVDWAAVVNPGN